MAKEYPAEVKAQVMAALLAGQTIRKVSAETGVPKSTVAAWGKDVGDVVPSVPDTKKEVIGELLIALLIAKLKSQISMSEHAGDKAWLKEQDASSFAMLLGVSDDKLLRLLEKFSNAGPDSGIAEG